MNVLGMTIGLTLCILLGAYCVNEYGYDSFHTNKESIYQVWATVDFGPNTADINRFSAATGEEIARKFNEVSSFARTSTTGKATLSNSDGLKFQERSLIFADSSFFEIFTFPMIEGDASFFDEPNRIIISEKIRQKYFGKADVLGKNLIYNDSISLQIIGVFRDIPVQSSIKFDFAISLPTLKRFQEFKNDFAYPKLGLGRFKTYLLIQNSSDAKALANILPKVESGFKIIKYHLEPLVGLHVRNYGSSEKSQVGLFSTIVFVIFFIIIVNSISIVTSLNIERTKEIIIRKINGASKISIVFMFLIESFILSLISIALSIVLAILLLEPIQLMLSIQFELGILFINTFIYWIIAALFLMTAATAIYPALILSTLKPVLSLTHSLNNSIFTNYARKLSILIQFTISSTLVVGVLLLQDQLSYFKDRDMEIDIDDVLVFKLSPEDAKNYAGIHQKVKSLPGVENIGAANLLLFAEEPITVMVKRSDSVNSVALSMLIANQDFIRVIKIQGFIDQIPSGLIINETASKSYSGNSKSTDYKLDMGNTTVPVVAIVRDFNFSNLKNKIGNLAITIATDSTEIFRFTGCYVYLKLAAQSNTNESIKQIENIYNEFVPFSPFSYSILTDTYLNNFKSENNLSKSLSLFSVLAMFISGFGMAGLLYSQIARKMKDLSIRRVLGANFSDIGYLLFSDLFVLVLIGLIIGIPISVYLSTEWFKSFQYKTEINTGSVIYGSSLILMMTFLIGISFVKKASRINPVIFLRKD